MKLRYERKMALSVADQLCSLLRPSCERIEIAGSLRRCKPDVGDIEILYIPKIDDHPDQQDLFDKSLSVNLADEKITELIENGILEKRLSSLGRAAYGVKNKLMRHRSSGIPVDLFAATESNWFNYLVCRTGPAELNQRIASAAIQHGWKWNPYGSGFTDPDGKIVRVESERDVFELIGMRYREPKDRA